MVVQLCPVSPSLHAGPPNQLQSVQCLQGQIVAVDGDAEAMVIYDDSQEAASVLRAGSVKHHSGGSRAWRFVVRPEVTCAQLGTIEGAAVSSTARIGRFHSLYLDSSCGKWRYPI